MRTRLVSVLIMAAFVFAAAPAVAQERSIESYDKEIGLKYAGLYEEGGHTGHGLLVDGGLNMRLCAIGGWRCQVIAELMVLRLNYYDSTFTQLVAGVRLGKLMTPKLRTFVQFQIGAQRDGLEKSATATVFMPGGGISYALTRKFDLHGTIDAPVARYDNGTFNQARLAVGIGMPLGGN